MPLDSLTDSENPHLSEQECRVLLAGASSGHLALSQSALPIVVPVTCALDGSALVVRAGLGLIGRVPLQPGVVAFATAGTSPGEGWGWEVLVQGRCDVSPEGLPRKSPPPLGMVDNALTTVLLVQMERLTGRLYGSAGPRPRVIEQRR
jgi:hypothetical protein